MKSSLAVLEFYIWTDILKLIGAFYVTFHCKHARKEIKLIRNFRVKTPHWHKKDKMCYIINRNKHHLITAEEYFGDPLK
jgi:hypothetical protein